jgi:hypothetical protein
MGRVGRRIAYETLFRLDAVANKMTWISTIETSHLEIPGFHRLLNNQGEAGGGRTSEFPTSAA